MLVQLYRRRVWVRSGQLLEALPELPDEIKEADLLAMPPAPLSLGSRAEEKFPNMCKAWLSSPPRS